MEPNIQTEVFKTFGLAILRHLMTLAGGFLVAHNVIDATTSGILTSSDFIYAVLGLIIAGGSWLWQYRRAKYAVALPKAALAAEPGTPLSVVKTEVKNNL